MSRILSPNQVSSPVQCPMLCVCVYVCVCVCTHSRPTLCDPMDCSPPGSSVHVIFQARILEWVAISSSRESSQTRDQTHVSHISCIGSNSFHNFQPHQRYPFCNAPQPCCVLMAAYVLYKLLHAYSFICLYV